MKTNKLYLVSVIRIKKDYKTKLSYVFETDDYLDATADFEVTIKNENIFLNDMKDPKNKGVMYSVVTFFSKMKGVVKQTTIKENAKE
jgi:hypothetical protein